MRLNDDAQRAYSVQDYAAPPAIQGVELVDLKRIADDGGNFTEPGAIKAFHIHRGQTDVWFVPPGDKMLLVLLDVRAGSPTSSVARRLVLGDGASRLVRIPPGVAHGVKNLAATRGRIIYFVDVQFQAVPAECDEGRLPWDFAGAAVWDVVRG